MNEITSQLITINAPELPLKVDFILNEIKKQGIEPIRWAIIEAEKNTLTLSVSGYKINDCNNS